MSKLRAHCPCVPGRAGGVTVRCMLENGRQLAKVYSRNEMDFLDQTTFWRRANGELVVIAEMTEEEIDQALETLDDDVENLYSSAVRYEVARVLDPEELRMEEGLLSLGVLPVRRTEKDAWLDSTALYRALLRAWYQA